MAILTGLTAPPLARSQPPIVAAAMPRVPVALNTNMGVRFVIDTIDGSGAKSVRIARDPTTNQLYYLKSNGDIYQIDPGANGIWTRSKRYGAADHGLTNNVQGLAFGPDGSIYLTGNLPISGGKSNIAQIAKGVPDGSGHHDWHLLAQTEPYPLSGNGFDHLWNGLVVSPDGNSLYVNCGSRTDHGEVQSNAGSFPDTRDLPLTAKILCLPTRATNLVLLNSTNFLINAGYLFADGTRNTFDMAFAPNGDLFGADNGPDRDMSDELNWLRRGQHYGFPWRMGGADNPQQFADYDPSVDLLLNPTYPGVRDHYYYNDPAFPPPPGPFAEPVVNLGPDADSFRDPSDGQVKRAGLLGQTLSTVTAHRSPLGLVFDLSGSMAPPFHRHGFLLSWSPAVLSDPSGDMLDLDLTRLGETNYQAHMTRIVGGFVNPLDAEAISNRIYVLEYGGNQSIWEITFPGAQPSNNAPSLPGQTNRTIFELTSLIVTNTASDIDLPANALTYQLLEPPLGALIDSAGIITWTPSEEQGPGTYTLTTVASDAALSVTNSFLVTVTELNSPPSLPAQTNRTIFELTSLIVTNTASDIDLPANELTYQLLEPPLGALIDSAGIITWTPSEAQGPGAYTLTTVVSDAALSATNSFLVMVTEVNSPPSLPAQTNRTIFELTSLIVTNTASDIDLPANELTYQLLEPPLGALIDSAGIITWTPSEEQGPGAYTLTTVVSDAALSATNSFLVTVTEVNSPPSLPAQTNCSIAELTSLIVTNTASDTDLPANELTYQLLEPPLGALIDSAGIITWTPSEEQGPGTYTLTTVVSDAALSVTNSFLVTVTEVNSPPSLPAQTNRTVFELTSLIVTNTGSDTDLPANELTYQLLEPPLGALIDSAGVVTWTPNQEQGPGDYTLTTVVNDGTISATNSFQVRVLDLVPAVILATGRDPDGHFQFTASGSPGVVYRIQGSTNLIHWEVLQTVTNTDGTIQFLDPTSPGLWQRFYRLVAP